MNFLLAILFVDLPGFGESERIDIGKNPEETWPAILEEVITSLIPKEFFLAGHSLGGWLGTLLSLRKGMKNKIKGELKHQYAPLFWDPALNQ